MKKSVILLVILGIVGFVFLPFGNKTMIASVSNSFESIESSHKDRNRNELMAIASILEEEQVSIEEWAVHSREQLTSITNLEDVRKLQTKLMKEFPNWDWTIHRDNGKWETIATKTSNDYKETIQILATLTNEKLHSYLIYEVKGTKWNKKTNDFFHKNWNSRLSNIFRGNPTNFSCMKADISDKIVKSLERTSKKWIKVFNAEEIESLHESQFVSISASSPLFAGKILTKDKEMNLQIAIRSNGLGAKTTLVVGTPIITIEY